MSLGRLEPALLTDRVSRDDHIAAVFTNENHAEAAIGDLTAAGLGSDELGVALRLGERTIFGGLLGADVGDVEWTQHENLAFVHLNEGEVLVVVRSHDRAPLCRHIFTRHNGRFLGDEGRTQLQ